MSFQCVNGWAVMSRCGCGVRCSRLVERRADGRATTRVHRRLSSDGSISFKFQWHDPADTRDPMEMLIGESIEFDDNDKASQAQRLAPPELEALLDNAPTEVQ